MRFSIIASAALALSACSAGSNLSAADAAIDTFHDRLNNEQFDTIYARSDPSYRSATTKSASLKFLSSVRAKLGNFKSGKRTAWRVNYGTDSGTVVQFESEFDNGKAQEVFTFGNGAGAPLIGYNVNSTVFVTG